MALNTPSPSLCAACRSIFTDCSYERWQHLESEPEDAAVPLRRHPSERSFNEAVQQHCWICTQIAQRESELGRRGIPSFDERNTYTLWCEDYSDSKFSLFLPETYSGTAIRIDKVDRWTESFALAHKSKAQLNTGSEDIARLARQWLQDCESGHKCERPTNPRRYPTRLLDVSEDLIRLVIPHNNPNIQGPYATLSHCWGTRRFLVLTSENMSGFLTGQAISQFPRTFQEKIITVRRLGIRYLWIDCYCIMQGADRAAVEDWKQESGQMLEVYSHSFLNIGAAHSSSPYDGLFCNRLLHESRTLFLEWRPTKEMPSAQYMLFQEYGEDKKLSDSFYDLKSCAISKRGWVIQETVLSPRMLYFTDKQVLWQCTEAAACEDFPQEKCSKIDWAEKYHPFWALSDSSRLLRTNRLAPPKDNEPDQAEQIVSASPEQKWFLTLESYCQASLTYPDKDIFKAIDGVGAEVAALTGRDYGHGILSGTLALTLLWEAAPGARPEFRSPLHRAPTWHWASYHPQSFNLYTTIYILYDYLRRGIQRFAALAHLFMSDSCEEIAYPPTMDLWPDLMCIGRPLMLNIIYVDPWETPIFSIRGTSIPLRTTYYSMDIKFPNQRVEDQFAFLPLIARFKSKEFLVDGLKFMKCGTRFTVYCSAGLEMESISGSEGWGHLIKTYFR